MGESFECPYCGVLAQMNPKAVETDTKERLYQYIFSCENCEKLIFRCQKFTPTRYTTKLGEIVHQYPVGKISVHESVPKDIADLYKEGVRCLNVNSANGSMTCFRKCLQKICKSKDADETKDLWEQIDSVLEGRVVELSTEIRKWGNIGAHPDKIIPDPTIEQAKQAKEFLEIVFMDEYEVPAKIEQSKKQRKGN